MAKKKVKGKIPLEELAVRLTKKYKASVPELLRATRHIEVNCGWACPFCPADQSDVSFGNVEIKIHRAYRKNHCTKCGAIWQDGYTLDSVMFEAPVDTEFIYPKEHPKET